ncbi:MAG: VanZ family protein [Bacteroidota bacterium]
MNHRFRLLLTISYTIVMMWLLFFYRGNLIRNLDRRQDITQHKVYLIPFETTAVYIRTFTQPRLWRFQKEAIINLGGNVLMFVPLGWLMMAWREEIDRYWRHLLDFAGISFLVESIQLVFRVGTFDVDDIILNSLGAMIGLILWIQFQKVRHRLLPATV